MPRRLGYLIVVFLSVLCLSGISKASDRHAGYYYPDSASQESYGSKARALPGANRTRRVGFIVNVTKGLIEQPYAPTFAMFAKGADAEKMLIVALEDDVLDTIYRARAQLAVLTSVARTMPIFRNVDASEINFFDLLKMLGFTQLTISDGDHFAHQVLIE